MGHFNGWRRALFVAADHRRGGLTAWFTFSLLITGIALYDMQFALYAHISWPEQLMVIIMFIVGSGGLFLLVPVWLIWWPIDLLRKPQTDPLNFTERMAENERIH